MTELGFRCPQCGTPLGYQGLCWKCQSERTRQEVLAWSSEHIRDVQASVLKGIKKGRRMGRSGIYKLPKPPFLSRRPKP